MGKRTLLTAIAGLALATSVTSCATSEGEATDDATASASSSTSQPTDSWIDIEGVVSVSGRITTNGEPQGQCRTRETSTAADIADRAKVTLYMASGRAVAVNNLQPGIYPTSGRCDFKFTLTAPPGERAYALTVGDRDKVWFTPDEIASPVLTITAE